MAGNRQYLRIGLMGTDFLLSSSSSFTIEKREQLEIGASGSAIAAWQSGRAGRNPAYSLDADLNPAARHAWQRAVFVQEGSQVAGLIADELQLLAREDVRVEPFQPPGSPATSAGHLFNGAWVRAGRTPILVFNSRALLAFLARFGE